MNPLEMVVLIVAIIAVANVLKTRRLSHREDREGLIDVTPANPQDAGETRRLREEVSQLKQRLQVLERITVEKENSLEREIEQLRDR